MLLLEEVMGANIVCRMSDCVSRITPSGQAYCVLGCRSSDVGFRVWIEALGWVLGCDS